MAQIDVKKAEILKKNIENLLKIADLTWEALEDELKISFPTLRRVQDLKTNLSKKNKRKIELFFGIPEKSIDSSDPIDFPNSKTDSPYISFKEGNSSNLEYFKSKADELKAAKFVRTLVLKHSYFEQPRRKSDMIEKLKTFRKYKKSYKDSAMAKEIERMHKEDGTLNIKDPHSNKSYFLYYRNK
ncbi:hypothetical protein [Anditalea andensis]|uniref:Uncharacterized protein n=1 Tax=Anditalea andensis TaxID=1048983 RepID=A0A074KP20_9BACT|nr:hypothetical protein [Anditalea andensis]KEO71671.1 hypothetical protein EL17_23465 [Anditalea andensis]